MQNTLC